LRTYSVSTFAERLRAGGDPVTTSDREAVAALEQAVIQRIGEPRYQLWFARHARFRWEDGVLVVGVPNLHFQEWLSKTFGEALRSAAAEVYARPIELRFQIDPDLFQAARREQEAVASASAPTLSTRETRPCEDSRVQLNPPEKPTTPPVAPPVPAVTKRVRRWHRLSEFVVGPCSRVAHAAAVSVIEDPGQGVNPLVLHGPVGTGKTHLLEGIYAGLRKAHPDWRVCFTHAEDFTNRFVQALRHGKLSGFRPQFRECDALLLDDVDFLASKKATHEEFQHTFDALQREGRQIVLTCACHPRLDENFSPELADRLLGGAVWGLLPPEAETRYAIMRHKTSQDDGPPMPETVLRHLADQLRGNVRELEGALHSLRHYSRVTGRPIDLSVAREALADLLRHSVRVVQLADIDHAVCSVLQLQPGALQSKARTWAVSHPRMLAMFLARKHTAASYGEVGRYLGGRNHSTAVAAEKKVRQWLRNNDELHLGERRLRVRDLVERIERALQQ
jgi:chromosomal replication initiator protein